MRTVVVGGGASGMISAYFAARKGNEVILLEKNEKLGKKIYITGKGRCNLTNNSEVFDFLQNVTTNAKFLHSAINSFTPKNTIDFFTSEGLKLKTERGNRVFPESDKSSDVIKTLEKALLKMGVDVRLNTKVKRIITKDSVIYGVVTEQGEILCDSVIICTGGLSYPLTGSTGDGFKFAKELGHDVIPLKPSLVGLELIGNDFSSLQGLSLKNIGYKVQNGDKVIFSDFGEMLFTHFGVSGPVVLSSSCMINKMDVNNLSIVIDLKPALNLDMLEKRLIREFAKNNKKTISNVMPSLLPKSLITVILKNSNISQKKICAEITKEERQRLISSLKSLTFKIKALRPIDEAIVTSGGVDVKQINPKTMESKIIKGLYFGGEVMDVDAFTGGFNLQIAFSTGFIAGNNC